MIRPFFLVALALTSPAVAQEVHFLESDVSLAWETIIDTPLAAEDDPKAIAAAAGRVFVLHESETDPTDVASVHAHDGETGERLWTTTYVGQPGITSMRPELLVASADASRVYAVLEERGVPEGVLFGPQPRRLIVIAYEGATGDELWVQVFTVFVPLLVFPEDAALSNDGSRLYVGGWVGPFFTSDAFVMALDTADGSILWTDAYDGPDEQQDLVVALAVDPVADRVCALLESEGVATAEDFVTRVLDGTDGSLLWQAVHAGPGSEADLPRDVVCDGTTVYVGGATESAAPLVGYAAATGAPVFSDDFGGADLDVLALSPGNTYLAALGAVPGGTQVRLEGIALVPGPPSWTSTYETNLAQSIEGRGLAYSADGSALAVAADFEFDPLGSDLQESVGYVVDAIDGSLAWELLQDVPAEGGFPVDVVAFDAAGSSRAAWLGSALAEDGERANVRAFDVDTAAPAWEAFEPGPVPTGFDRACQVLVSADQSRAWALTLETLPDLPLNPGWATIRELDVETGATLWVVNASEGSLDDALRLWPDESRLGLLGRAGTAYQYQVFDADDGTHLWTSTWEGPNPLADFPSSAAVAPDGNRVFVTGHVLDDESDGSGTDGFYGTVAWDTLTGDLLWTALYAEVVDTLQNALAADVAASPDSSRVYVTGRTSDGGDEKMTTVAYDAETGLELWVSMFDGPGDFRGEKVHVSPDGARVYVAGQRFSIEDGVAVLTAVALDAATGALLWSDDEGTLPSLGTGSMFMVDAELGPLGSVYYHMGYATLDSGLTATRVAALAALTGERLWTSAETGPEDLRGVDLDVSPDGRSVLVVARGDTPPPDLGVLTRTYALDAGSGARLWVADHDTEQAVPNSVAAADRFALVATDADLVGSPLDGVILRYDPAPLTSGPSTVSLSEGGSQALLLSAPPEEAFQAYLVAGSATGIAPPTLVGGEALPLVFDAYFLATLAFPNLPPFLGTLGLLDEAATGQAAISLPPGLDPTLAGATLFHAFLVLGPGLDVRYVSNPSPLLLVP